MTQAELILCIVQAIQGHVRDCANCRIYMRQTKYAVEYGDLSCCPAYMSFIADCVVRLPVVASLLERRLCSYGDVLAVVCAYVKKVTF